MLEQISENSSDATLNGSSNDSVSAETGGLDERFYYLLASHIYFYGLAIIMPFGIIGNCFSLCVIVSSRILRRTTTGHWIVALAVADTFVLLSDLIKWFSYKAHHVKDYQYFPSSWGLDGFDTSAALCKFRHVIRYAGFFWSNWITVCLAVERLVVVSRPLESKRILTVRRTRIVIAIVYIIGLGIGLVSIWIFDIRQDTPTSCKIIENLVTFGTIWSGAIVGIGISLFCCVCIAIASGFIIYFLHRARHIRQTHLDQANRRQTFEISMETQLTIMLVVICVSTVALKFPYLIFYFLRQYKEQIWIPLSPTVDLVTYFIFRVLEMVHCINFAINFLFYCICGNLFREEAKRLIFCDVQKTQVNDETVELTDA